jgi:hypothetical protein
MPIFLKSKVGKITCPFFAVVIVLIGQIKPDGTRILTSIFVPFFWDVSVTNRFFVERIFSALFFPLDVIEVRLFLVFVIVKNKFLTAAVDDALGAGVGDETGVLD